MPTSAGKMMSLLLGRRGISRRRTLPERGGHPPTLERGRTGVGGQEARGHCRGSGGDETTP